MRPRLLFLAILGGLVGALVLVLGGRILGGLALSQRTAEAAKFVLMILYAAVFSTLINWYVKQR